MFYSDKNLNDFSKNMNMGDQVNKASTKRETSVWFQKYMYDIYVESEGQILE